MSPVKREWLIHGCMKLGDYDLKERVTWKVRRLISEMYGGNEFRIEHRPRQHFPNTTWWYEKSIKVPYRTASYFLKLDNRRGPNLYVGISVEKGYEDKEVIRKVLTKNKQRVGWLLLDKSWDWHRFVSSLLQVKSLVLSAAKELQSELYFSFEFHDIDRKIEDSKYYVIAQNQLYWRGGFKPVDWEGLLEFVKKDHKKLWGNVYLARAFTLSECSPYLEEARLIEVFKAMRPIRDIWRGLQSAMP